MSSIYGEYEAYLPRVLDMLREELEEYDDKVLRASNTVVHVITIVEEKDYIRHSKPNGYRSYHMILLVETDFPDIDGNTKGKYYAEVQLRTIAMDSWASLEHKMSYKKDIMSPELIMEELKRCADELAACDVSMETIRKLIRSS